MPQEVTDRGLSEVHMLPTGPDDSYGWHDRGAHTRERRRGAVMGGARSDERQRRVGGCSTMRVCPLTSRARGARDQANSLLQL